MALNLEQKKRVVAEVSEIAQNALSVVAAEYHGLGADDITTLRKQARDRGVCLRVIKNTLAKRAVQGTEFECMQDKLTGPLMFGFCRENPGDAARLFRDFAKEHDDALHVKVIVIGGEALGSDALERVASLPTREQALSQLLGTMQAPIAKFIGTLNEVPGKLVRTLAAIKDQREG